MIRKILGSKHVFVIIIFLAAFAFRLILINTTNQSKISPDGTGYHTVAVNLVKGNGYSNSSSVPFEKYFFREPGYPVLISCVYKIFEILGGDPDYLDDYNLSNYSYTNPHLEIKLLKYFQAFIASFTIVFFYLSLLLFFKRKYAFLIALVIALYFPIAVSVTYVLRETLQAFFSMLMVYSFIKFLFSKKYKWIILFAVFWAFSNLTFQFSLIMGIFLFIFLLIYSKKLGYSIKISIIASIVMFLVSSPWLIKSYNYYPDWKIIKSYGTSMTFEYRSLIGAVMKAQYYSYITDEDFDNILRIGYIDIPEKEKFEKSFNGEIVSTADSINKLIDEPFISKRKANKTRKAFLNSWFQRINLNEIGEHSHISPQYNIFGFNIYSINHLTFTLLSIVIGLLGLFGFVLFFHRIYPLLLVFTMYMSLFFVIGTESRRMLPAQPFIIMFSILAIFILYFWLFKKESLKNSITKLFNDDYSMKIKNVQT